MLLSCTWAKRRRKKANTCLPLLLATCLQKMLPANDFCVESALRLGLRQLLFLHTELLLMPFQLHKSSSYSMYLLTFCQMSAMVSLRMTKPCSTHMSASATSDLSSEETAPPFFLQVSTVYASQHKSCSVSCICT